MKSFPVFIVGFTGAGKTTYGKKLSKKLKVPFIDLDAQIESEYKMPITAIFEKYGEDFFRKIESDTLRKISLTHSVIACGGGTACFHDNMEWMNANGHTIYLKAEPNFIVNNLLQANPDKRPLISGKNKEQLTIWVLETLKTREPFYLKAKEIADAGKNNGHASLQ